jgi:hypothetical protein
MVFTQGGFIATYPHRAEPVVMGDDNKPFRAEPVIFPLVVPADVHLKYSGFMNFPE